MKDHFPFTDYDFYAYLASGFGLLLVLDVAITGGTYIVRDDWSIIQIILAISAAYAVGHLVASLSSPIIELWFARTAIYPPAAILLGLRTPRVREKIIGKLAGRYYEPLSPKVRSAILSRAAASLGITTDEIEDPEDVFQVAFPAARRNEDTRSRMDDLRNQYGFSRNIALVALTGTVAFCLRAYLAGEATAWTWAALAFVLGTGMLIRFLKFYSSYAAEVLRAFAFGSKD